MDARIDSSSEVLTQIRHWFANERMSTHDGQRQSSIGISSVKLMKKLVFKLDRCCPQPTDDDDMNRCKALLTAIPALATIENLNHLKQSVEFDSAYNKMVEMLEPEFINIQPPHDSQVSIIQDRFFQMCFDFAHLSQADYINLDEQFKLLFAYSISHKTLVNFLCLGLFETSHFILDLHALLTYPQLNELIKALFTHINGLYAYQDSFFKALDQIKDGSIPGGCISMKYFKPLIERLKHAIQQAASLPSHTPQ